MNLAGVRLRQALERTAAGRAVLIGTIGAIFLALLGPFGTDAAPPMQRFLYWFLLVEIGVVFGIGASMALHQLLDPEDKHVFLIAVLTAVVISPPISAVVFEVTKRFFQADGHGGGFARSGDLLGFIPPVFVISTAISLINALARSPVHTRPAMLGASPPSFTERLPPKLRGAEIYAVQAEDHYLRLHTSRGSDLILMRLSDAIAELDGIEGAQTHRSWWVARTAVRGARRIKPRAILELPGGLEAPVSRTFVAALKAEGWF